MNDKQRTIKALTMLGMAEHHGFSKKYRVFASGSVRYLVGKSGALRKTRGTIAESISLTNGMSHQALRQLGEFPTMPPSDARKVLDRILAS